MGLLKVQYENIKVSVVVPIYNVEKYLKECMDSICAQTYSNIEIICVNDGSTDACGEILDWYAKKDARIKVVHKENAGYGHAVNVGMDLAIGKYIQVVEPDDYINQNMTFSLVQIAEKYNLDIVKADFNIFKGDGENRLFSYANIAQEGHYNVILSAETENSIFYNKLYTWAGIFRREFIEKNQIRHNESPGASFQDNGFWFQTIALAKRVMYINQPFYYLRRDNPNSSFYSTNKIYAISNEYDFIKNFIVEKLDGKKIYLELHNKFRINNYRSIASRLDEKYEEEFHKKVMEDIKRETQENNIDVELLSEKGHSAYEKIMNDNRDWICVEKYFVVREKMEQLKNAKSIIIYGAGQIGQRTANLYCSLQLPIIGFAVSECSEDSEVDGLPVKSIDTWGQKLEDAIIIVAVGKKFENEMIANLNRRHIYNYITLD